MSMSNACAVPLSFDLSFLSSSFILLRSPSSLTLATKGPWRLAIRETNRFRIRRSYISKSKEETSGLMLRVKRNPPSPSVVYILNSFFLSAAVFGPNTQLIVKKKRINISVDKSVRQPQFNCIIWKDSSKRDTALYIVRSHWVHLCFGVLPFHCRVLAHDYVTITPAEKERRQGGVGGEGKEEERGKTIMGRISIYGEFIHTKITRQVWTLPNRCVCRYTT